MDYNELKQIAETKKIEVREIANELEMTTNGFRESIKNETIQLKKLRKLCELLHIHPLLFFEVKKGVYLKTESSENKERENSQLREQLSDKNEIIKMLREKINHYENNSIAATPKTNYKK